MEASLLGVYPSVLCTGVFDACVEVLDTGRLYRALRQDHHEIVDGVLVTH